MPFLTICLIWESTVRDGPANLNLKCLLVKLKRHKSLMRSAMIPREIHSLDFIGTFIPCESILKPSSSPMMMHDHGRRRTSRSRNDVVHTLPTHKLYSHSNNSATTSSTLTLLMSEPLKAGKTVSWVFNVVHNENLKAINK